MAQNDGRDFHLRFEQRDGAHGADHGGAAGHVVLHFFHAVGGLDGNAAGVEGDAFADQSQHRFLGSARGFVAQDDQRGRFVGALGDAPESSHLQFLDLVGAVNFAFQADFRRHLFRAVGEDGRRHAIGGFIDQVASEILRFADDAGFVHCRLQLGLIAASDDGQRVNLLVLAIALVVVGIEVADERAFHDGLDRVLHLQPGFGREEGEAAQPLRFERAHGGASEAAQVECRKGLGFAAAEQQQSFGFQFRRAMQQCGFKRLAGDFAAGDHVSGGVFNGGVEGLNRNLRLVPLSPRFFSALSSTMATRHSVSTSAGLESERLVFMIVCGSSIVGGKGIRQEAGGDLAAHGTSLLWRHPEGPWSRRILRVLPRIARRLHMRFAPDPSQAQDDASVKRRHSDARLPETSEHDDRDPLVPPAQIVSCFSSGRALMRAHACSSDLAQSSPKMQARISPRPAISVKRLCAAIRISPPAPVDP